MMTKMMSAQECMDLEKRYGAHNYHPLPVVLMKGKRFMTVLVLPAIVQAYPASHN